MTDWRVSNVAEYAIAKSSSWHGGAHQCDRSFADELPMGPRSRASHDTTDTASPEVISGRWKRALRARSVHSGAAIAGSARPLVSSGAWRLDSA